MSLRIPPHHTPLALSDEQVVECLEKDEELGELLSDHNEEGVSALCCAEGALQRSGPLW